MKQFIKKSLVLVVLFTTLIAYSNGEIQTKGKSANSVSNVILENVQEGTLLLVKDKSGDVLHKEHIKLSGTYTRGFDFTNLPDADYCIELDRPDIIEILPFTVSSGIAEFVKTDEHLIAKPMVNVDKACVSISKSTIENQAIEIEVYYEGSELASTLR